MRAAILVPVLAALLPLAACQVGADDNGPGIPGTGSGNNRTYAVADFDGIDLAGMDEVDVRLGTGYSVRAEGAPADLDRLKIDKHGRTLTIGRRNHGLGWEHGNKIRLFVTMPRLTDASVSGSGSMSVDRVQGAAFKGEVAGSGVLAIAALAVDKATADLAGSGTFRASGTAHSLDATVAGSGGVDAANLITRQASVSVTGSGSVKARVNGPATVSMTGSGMVNLGPNARCSTSKMGSGTVHCGA